MANIFLSYKGEYFMQLFDGKILFWSQVIYYKHRNVSKQMDEKKMWLLFLFIFIFFSGNSLGGGTDDWAGVNCKKKL